VTKKSKKPTDAGAWDALRAEVELERIKHLSPEEVAKEIRDAGGDPEAIGARGAELAKRLLAERKDSWQTRAKKRAAETERRTRELPDFSALTRAELLARLAELRSDNDLPAPLAEAARKHTGEEATDDELRALLEDIERLRRMHERGEL
jgi:hypothetical protein